MINKAWTGLEGFSVFRIDDAFIILNKDDEYAFVHPLISHTVRVRMSYDTLSDQDKFDSSVNQAKIALLRLNSKECLANDAFNKTLMDSGAPPNLF